MRRVRTSLDNYYKTLGESLIKEYSSKYKFYETSEYATAYCYVSTNEIYIPTEYSKHPCLKYLFDIFHEVGHLETNTDTMESYECEYLATVWALKECERRKIRISSDIVAVYQQYIMDHRDKSPNKTRIPNSAIRLPVVTKPVIGNMFTGQLPYIEVSEKTSYKAKRVEPKQIIDIPEEGIDIVAQTSKECCEDMDLIDYIKSVHIEYVDKRLKNGNLTLVGDEKSLSTIVDYICKVYGITGRYSSSLKAIKHRAGWWTRG